MAHLTITNDNELRIFRSLEKIDVPDMRSLPERQSFLVPSTVSSQPRKYEFIDVKDKDGARNAKSHAVKDSFAKRRQKLAEISRLQKLKRPNRRIRMAAGPDRVERFQTLNVASPMPNLAGNQVDQFGMLPVKLNRKDIGL